MKTCSKSLYFTDQCLPFVFTYFTQTISTTFFLVPWCSTTGEKSPAQGFLTWKNQSLQYRGKSPVQGFFVKTQSLQYRDKVSHTGELWKISKPHTPGNYENLQSLHTPHSTEATHRGTLKIFKVPHSTKPTHQRTLKIFKVWTHSTEPTRQRTLKISKSPHTTQHRAHHRDIIFPIGIFQKKINLFQYGGFWKIPSTGIFREKSISPAQGHQGAHRKKKRCYIPLI